MGTGSPTGCSSHLVGLLRVESLPMAVLPYMPFYPADWIRDTRCLSVATRGIWFDILCELWHAPQRGTKTMTIEQWARAVGCSILEFDTALKEMKSQSISDISCDSNGNVTLMSRRMIRDEKEREFNRIRQKNHRDKRLRNGVSNGEITPYISEVISQKSESEKNKKEKKGSAEGEKSARSRRLSDEEFLQSLRTNPAYTYLNLDIELGKMDAWLTTRPGRQKTRKFIVNWLNKIDKPVGSEKPKPPPFPPATDPIARNLWRKAYGDPSQYGY